MVDLNRFQLCTQADRLDISKNYVVLIISSDDRTEYSVRRQARFPVHLHHDSSKRHEECAGMEMAAPTLMQKEVNKCKSLYTVSLNLATLRMTICSNRVEVLVVPNKF